MVVVITGASSGIGRAVAERYVRQGAIVAAVTRRAQPPTSLSGSGKLISFRGNVTDRRVMADIVKQVEQTLGPVDLAIACAGIAEEQATPDLDLEALDQALATNVCGAFNLLAPAAARMRSRGSGHLVAISSLAAELILPQLTGYCISKAALNSGMQGLSLLLRGTGVSTTTICPGFIATGMTAGRVRPGRCMDLDQAVDRILRAIQRRQRICRFPVWQYQLLRLLRVMPARVQERVLESADNLLFDRARRLGTSTEGQSHATFQ